MFVDFNILNQLGSPSINSNTFANRPAAGQTGRLFVSTDTFEIYRDNGTTWDLIGGPGSSTITGTGTATQVAYFTSSQAIGSSANLFWDNTNGFLGVGTATPSARIEAVKTDGVGIYSNFTTNAGSGSSTTALWAKNVTNSSGFAAVIEETTPNTTAGQYPLLIKHSLSSGTAGVGMGTGIHWQLPDDAGTFKTTQLTVETIDAAAATYKTRYRFNVQNNGSSLPVGYINATGLGIFVAAPSGLIHADGGASAARIILDADTGVARIFSFRTDNLPRWALRVDGTETGSNAGADFSLRAYDDTGAFTFAPMSVTRATGKTSWQAQQTYTTGLARGNYFDYNLSVSAGGSFSSPNAITALGASLDLTLAGSATIPSGARSGLDAYNSISFTGTGTLTHNQGAQIRAYSNVTAGWAFNGSATGTITHLAGLRALFPDNTGSAVTVTNNYALLLNDQTANTGTVTYTNRWGVYQEGASDLNYMAANLLLGSTTNSGEKLQVTGYGKFWDSTQGLTIGAFTGGGFGAIYAATVTPSNVNHSFAASSGATVLNVPTGGVIDLEINTASALYIDTNRNIGINTNSANELLSLGFADNASNSIEFRSATYARLGIITGGNNTTSSNGYLAFSTRNGGSINEVMRITTDERVGISETSPSLKLDIQGTAASFPATSGTTQSTGGRLRLTTTGAATAVIDYGTAGGSGGWVQATNKSDLSTNYAYSINPNGGNVLIGTTTDAGQKLQVNGDLYTSGIALIKQTSQGSGGDVAINGKISICNSVTGAQTSMSKSGMQQSSGVTTGASTIFSSFNQGLSSAACAYFIIYGGDNISNGFIDVVVAVSSQTPVVISSSTVEGSPPARTYTSSTNNLQLAMASGTYNVNVKCTSMGYPF